VGGGGSGSVRGQVEEEGGSGQRGALMSGGLGR
jgi:hypothetical protein